jgi:copper chaperone CopZ
MIESLTLTVTGMKCGGCEANIIEKLSAISGVISVTASAKNNEVSIDYNNELTDIATIKSAIKDAGFEV